MRELLKKNRIWVIIGIVASILSCIPYFILREASIVTYHDQLDGELLAYIYNAKYMFSGSNVIPEIMNGISMTGFAMPAPAFVFFYKLLKPFWAYLASLIVVKVVGFIGTYLLIDKLTEKKWLAFLCGGGFMLLPFYAVYGLCIPGEPMLLYAILSLRDKEKKPFLYWGLIAIYAACSSLSLVGFAWICFMSIALLVAICRKKHIVRYFVALIVCVAVYMLENIGLIKQVLGVDNGFVSHKSEIIKSASPFFTSFWDVFSNGMDYTEVGQLYFFPVIILAFAMFGLFRFVYKSKSPAVSREVKYLVIGLGINCILATIYAVYSSETVVNICNASSGILREFNFGRVTWIMPVIWIAMLGMSLSILWDLYVTILDNKKPSIFARMIRFGIWAAYMIGVLATVVIFAIAGFWRSDLKYNISKLFSSEYYMMTWEQFYASDLFEEVDEIIGMDKADYRVVSYGIYPAAAAYNGFYCLDAYTNNYDVEYKHEFRKVIANELDKSEYLESWYDNWGNRCYLVAAETSNYFTMEKRWIPTTNEFDIDLEQLKTMGCHYIISASYIFNPEEKGLTLLNDNEEPIQTEGSWYRLWVYTF
ncbi:MAG: DUF6044 family protein [Lachnospiraceae bacterium]|nr:DUF6044 family protein [Lachnospiraceae bacterium]